jgi:pimeloyl-ACP methyl ester carboxylesterase
MRAGLMSVAVAALLLPACSPAPEAPAAPVAPAAAAPALDAEFPPALVETHFEIAGDRVNGIVYLTNGAGPHPTVVLLHGFPGNERNLDLAQDLRREGFNVLFFHYRGAWGSEGEYSLPHVIEDVAGATAYLRANASTLRVDPARILLVGHSMGGFAALQGASRDPAIKCVAGIAPAEMGAIAAQLEQSPERAAGFAAYADQLDMLEGLDGKELLADILANRDSYDLAKLAAANGRQVDPYRAGRQGRGHPQSDGDDGRVQGDQGRQGFRRRTLGRPFLLLVAEGTVRHRG